MTPMNTSLHVALKYLHTHVSDHMTKRVFLLTDGLPTQFKTAGGVISGIFLQKLVRKEINEARKKGIEVYTFVLADKDVIPDDAALTMFGPRHKWDRITNKKQIGDSLVKLVTREFVSHLQE